MIEIRGFEIDAAALLLLCLVLTLVLVALGLMLGRGGQAPGTNRGTRFFLVALRLAIGWHFLFEGLDKFHNPSWSSEAYVREAIGPAAPFFRELAGDSVLDRVEVVDKKLPLELDRDLQAYFDKFVVYYGLDSGQIKLAETKLEQQKAQLLTWLQTFTKPVQLPSDQAPPVVVSLTIPQRIQEYRKLTRELRDLEDEQRPRYGKIIFPKIKKARANVTKWRNELRSDLNEQLAQAKKTLQEVLHDDQKKMPPLVEPLIRPVQWWTPLEWSDIKVKYGLVAIGGLLLVGLFTRLACVGGALFLIAFFVAMPPLPTWPEASRVEGHYLYINKNIIEALALLALATTRSGRWCGIDGLMQFFPCCCWRRKSSSAMLEKSPEGQAAPHAHSSGLAGENARPGDGKETAPTLFKENPHGS